MKIVDLLDKLGQYLNHPDTEKIWFSDVRSYLEQGGDANGRSQQTSWTLLHYAADNEFKSIVEILIGAGADINSKTADGWTPYMIALSGVIDAAIQNDHVEIDFSIVKILLELGADSEICTESGESSHTIVAGYGQQAVAEFNKFISETL